MSSREAFGPNLRRFRLQRGISLEELSARTKVSTELWEAMERNDFSRWPTGLAARAYVRDYAAAVGADPEETVAEFCRVIPNGDRRAGPLLRKTAEILRHDLDWQDDLGLTDTGNDRRAPAAPSAARRPPQRNLRAMAAGLDALFVAAIGFGLAAVLQAPLGTSVAIVGLLYHAVSMAAAGASPSAGLIDLYFSARVPLRRGSDRSAFRRLPLMPVEPSPSGPDRHMAE